jgi:hypothetical protein
LDYSAGLVDIAVIRASRAADENQAAAGTNRRDASLRRYFWSLVVWVDKNHMTHLRIVAYVLDYRHAIRAHGDGEDLESMELRLLLVGSIPYLKDGVLRPDSLRCSVIL